MATAHSTIVGHNPGTHPTMADKKKRAKTYDFEGAAVEAGVTFRQYKQGTNDEFFTYVLPSGAELGGFRSYWGAAQQACAHLNLYVLRCTVH